MVYLRMMFGASTQFQFSEMFNSNVHTKMMISFETEAFETDLLAIKLSKFLTVSRFRRF